MVLLAFNLNPSDSMGSCSPTCWSCSDCQAYLSHFWGNEWNRIERINRRRGEESRLSQNSCSHDGFLTHDIESRVWIQRIRNSPAISRANARRRQGCRWHPNRVSLCLLCTLKYYKHSRARPLHGPPLLTPIRPSYKSIWLLNSSTAPDRLVLVVNSCMFRWH